MNQNELMIYRHWQYFQLLCEDLESTKRYVDHNNTNNLKTCSIEFLNLLLSISAEFEMIGKILCKEKDSSINLSNPINIVEISKKLLNEYSEINNIEIIVDNINTIKPLGDFQVNGTNNKVLGIDWWKAYTDLKHNMHDNFEKANLENVINALSSLLVLEICLQKEVLKEIKFYSCDYFFCKQFPYTLVT